MVFLAWIDLDCDRHCVVMNDFVLNEESRI